MRLRAPLAIGLGLLLVCAPALADPVARDDRISPLLGHGQSYVMRADAPATYRYHCHPHPWMVGTLVVQSGADPAGARLHRIAIVDDGNESNAAAMHFVGASGGNTTMVHVGDTIEWVNDGNLTHDVHLTGTLAGASEGPIPFEAWVLGGLVVVLSGIWFVSRRH